MRNTSFWSNFVIGALLLALGAVIGYKTREGALPPVLTQFANGALAKFSDAKILNATPPPEYKDVDLSLFWKVWQVLEQDYYDTEKIDRQTMAWGAIKGLASSLDDPYTFFLTPQEQKMSMEDLQGSFFGVGIQLGYVDGILAVQTPIKGSPAALAGLKPKDLIIHVKDAEKKLDEETQGWTLQQAVEKIRGNRGSTVTLTIYRKDDPDHTEPFKVDLKRDEVKVPSVEVKMIDKNGQKYALLDLTKFGEQTEVEFSQAVNTIKNQSPAVSGIILDLRNNPGGYLDRAVDIASDFIKDGLIVTQKGRYASQDYTSKGTGRLSGYKLVVLVNGGSASAAEILAGALHDRLKTTLIGEKTFGKGTVQEPLSLDNGAGLHVTIAHWLLPSGNWIHKEGIPVEVEIKDDPKTDNDEVVDKALEVIAK